MRFQDKEFTKKKAPSLLLGRQQYTIILKDKKILTNLGILMRKIWLTMQKKKSILNRIQNITIIIIIIIAQEKHLKTAWLRTSNNSNQWFYIISMEFWGPKCRSYEQMCDRDWKEDAIFTGYSKEHKSTSKTSLTLTGYHETMKIIIDNLQKTWKRRWKLCPVEMLIEFVL